MELYTAGTHPIYSSGVIPQGLLLLPILRFNFALLMLIVFSKSHYEPKKFSTMNSQIQICLVKPWECHFQRRDRLWGLRNHAQFSMKTISYSLLHSSVPAWGGWHSLFLMTSQAQMDGGKTILAVICQNVCHPFIYFFPPCFYVIVHASLSSSWSSLWLSSMLQSHRVIRYASSFKWCERFTGAC